ncbi:MFS transporter [Agromyces sp. Soil535]|uniref:MFS transporter n=1 Tax=Agromyces sp. Soil535 TaxID=1736390 RepID=UPI0006F35464|nr:MFS transporter [Agromyces sp. Soil535]KRE25768.1 MFS transporter [Agromyces sp. Soil535]
MANTSVQTAPGTRRAGVLQAELLLAGSCMPVLGSVLLTPILPQLSAEFGGVPGGEILVPLVVAIPALMIALFAPFAGQIVDSLGRKKLLIVAMFVYTLVGIAPAFLDTLPAILATRVGVGITEAAIMTVCTTLIVDYWHEPERRAKYLALQTIVTTLAATAFIAIGGAAGAAGWRTPFWIYLAAAIIAVPMIFLLWEPSRADTTDEHVRAPKVPIPWRRLALPLIVGLFGGFTFYVLIIEGGYLLVGAGVAPTDTPTIGGIAAVASLATAAGGFTFTRIAKVGPKRLLPAAFALQAAGMFLIWLVGGVPGVAAGAIVGGAGSGLLLPTMLTWALASIRFEERGRATGLWTASFFFGQFLTPILMGAITAAVGGALPVAVGVVGITCAVAAFLLGFGLRRSATTQVDEVTATA